jgi:hypothetical protein
MSSGPNHRRGHGRVQERGPTWENRRPSGGCNSTHVARGRRWWRTFGRRKERRTGKRQGKVRYFTGGGRQAPVIDED